MPTVFEFRRVEPEGEPLAGALVLDGRHPIGQRFRIKLHRPARPAQVQPGQVDPRQRLGPSPAVAGCPSGQPPRQTSVCTVRQLAGSTIRSPGTVRNMG